MNKRKFKKATKSLIKKGYLKAYPHKEIGLTEKGLIKCLELKEE